MKKLFAVLLALTLVLSMGTIALAADTGTITIDNALEGATYNIYKMLNFEPSNAAGDKGVYTIVAGWEDFFAAEPATNYFTVTDNNGKITVALKTEDTVVDQILAKAAIAYAENKKPTAISPTATKDAEGDKIDPVKGKEVKFEGLAFGYYAIDTSLGTMCALTRATSEFNAYEKNEKPNIDKEVQEDRDDSWGKVNDADINQVVNYKSTITVGVGATNYVMHDTMEAGLTFNNDVNAYILNEENNTTTPIDASKYTVTVNDATNPTKCTRVAEDGTTKEEAHTFHVTFDNDYILSLDKGTKILVTYSATLNENAEIYGESNDNTVYLSYGENSTWETAEHKTSTYTFKMDVEKYTMDGGNKINLAGAKFMVLKTENDEDSAIGFVQVTSVNGETVTVPTYRVAVDGDEETSVVKIIETSTENDANGTFEIIGLDEGTYYLHEKEAPEGYNKLAADREVVIASTHNDADRTASYTIDAKSPATIGVENNSGTLLPETGGIGTTIFYVVGGLLMAAAFILLVSKKRMATFA